MMMAAIKCPICKNRKSCEIMGMGDSAIQNCGMYCTEEPPRRSNGDVIRAIIPAEPFNNLSKPCKDDDDIPICTKASPASLGIYKKAEEGET